MPSLTTGLTASKYFDPLYQNLFSHIILCITISFITMLILVALFKLKKANRMKSTRLTPCENSQNSVFCIFFRFLLRTFIKTSHLHLAFIAAPISSQFKAQALTDRHTTRSTSDSRIWAAEAGLVLIMVLATTTSWQQGQG